MSSDEMTKAVQGSMDKLTHNATNIIRVFFSSTFTDMKEERNLLMREAVPELKSYCQDKGFDLEVVDMRWGVREDAATEHSTAEICLRAIDNCQNLSEGPNFVLFLGNKYGYRPLPSAIPVTEFRLLRRLAYWMEISFDVVEKWYPLDTNAVPAEYRILPITTLLPYYNNMNVINKTNRLVHIANWDSDERNMRNAFRKVSLMALEQGKITAEQCDRYFISVTESEVTKGILKYGELKDKVLYFNRSLMQIDTSDPVASRFIDMNSDGEIDKDAQDMLNKLSTVKLPKIMPAEQMLENAINWETGGINPEDDTHGRYLIMFSEWFKTLMKEQVDKAIHRCNESAIKNEMHAEVARHLATGLSKCQCFFGQDEMVNEILKLTQKQAKETVVEETPRIQMDIEEDNKEGNENKEIESEKETGENEEENNNNENGFNPPKTEEDSHKSEDEEEEKADAASSSSEDEEEGKDPVEAFVSNLKERGCDAPTVGRGLTDKSSDPTVNMREELVAFTQTEDYKHPIIIYGESGSGKSVILARLAQLIKNLEPNSVVILRFLGTTMQTKTIRNAMISVIKNIWTAYNVRHEDLELSSDMIYLGQYLQALIWQVSTPERPLYILLDALDQLLSLEQAHSLTWLPTILPPHGSLIMTTLPDHNSILENARRILPRPEQFIEVLPIGEAAAEKIISAISHMKSRSITRPQKNFLKERFKECPSPLYLKLITDQALKWRSHQVVKDLILGSNVGHAINHLMMNMEKDHGIIFVCKAFGYLTSMKQGATYSEIDHLLSLDNAVLQDTYIYHLPPDPIHIRFPSSVWSSLWLDAMTYLTTEGSHGNMTMTWYHRAFQEACAERYLTEETSKEIHCFAAKFFMGYWHNKVKPLKLFKVKEGWYPDNIRQVPAQPLYFKNGRLNYRKLLELPHHLTLGGMWREFHKEVVCNVNFLVAKVQAYGVAELRSDLMTFLKHRFEFTNEVMKDDIDEPPAVEEVEEDAEEQKTDSGDEQEEEDREKGDDDLFLTENKKQGETVREKSPEITPANSSPVEEIKESDNQADMETVLRDVEILIDIINLGIDAVRHSGLNLPSQIICQLGKHKAPTPSLQRLVDDCFEYMEDHELPLVKPDDACMAMPGGMLQTSINVEMHLVGADRNYDSPMQYNADDFYLYVVQAGAEKDMLLVLDMAQGGEKVLVADMKACVHSFRFNSNRKFLIMRCYKTLSKYQPSFFYQLYQGRQLCRYRLEKEALSMDVSAEGDIIAYADDRCCFICSPKRESLTLEVIYRLHHTESITNLMFSPNAYYLLTFNKFDGFKVWVPRRGEATLTIEGKQRPTYFTEQKAQAVYITKNQRLIQVLSEYDKDSTVVMYNLSSGEVIHQLKSPELAYRIDLMETDEEEDYLLVATKATSVVNGNKSKSALLWDLEEGKLVSRVSSTEPFQLVKVLVEENTIYIIAAQFSPHINIYSVGLRHRPLSGAKLIRTITCHTLPVLQLSINIPEGSGGGRRLVSASCDNTVKFWELDQVLTPEPKQTKKECGKTTCLAISKDDKYLFYGTVGGFVEQVSLTNGEKKTIADNLEHPVNFLRVSKNGKLLIAAAKDTVYVYQIGTGEMEYALESCKNGRISCLTESNNILVAGHSGMEAEGRIWDLANGHVIKDVKFLYSFYQTAVNSSGTQLGITMFEYPIMVDVFGSSEEDGAGVQMDQVDTNMSGCSHLEFSPDGKMLVSSGTDGRVRVIDAQTGKYLHTMVHPSSVITFVFSWDSRLLFTAGFKSVYVWFIGDHDNHPDDKKGQLKVKLSRHGDFVTSLKLVMESRFLITGSLDKTIAIWSMKTKTTICTFRAHCPISTMAVASDLSSIIFVPDQSANVAVLRLNKAAQEALKEMPTQEVTPTVKKAQAVALTFSSQEVSHKTSRACSIL